MSPQPTARPHQAGQALAIFSFGFLAFVGGVAFVVDGGNAYAQHRISQNATDAAAGAGAVVIAEDIIGRTRTDDEVLAAVVGVLASMDMDTAGSVAEYTDIEGEPIGVSVGDIGNGPVPAGAAGVSVTGERPFGTYFARALGLDSFEAVTHATAVAGWAVDQGTTFLPVTPPVNIAYDCTTNGEPDFGTDPSPWVHGQLYVIPLCSSGPGNVGWIDWDPTSGGTSELVDVISNPEVAPYVPVPSWQWTTETGDMSSVALEEALRIWDLATVRLPMFDDTCDVDPGAPYAACPGDPGHGSNQWYHFPTVARFELCGTYPDGTIPEWCKVRDANGVVIEQYGHGSYVSGASGKACGLNKNGTSCIVGRFVHFIRGGTVTGDLVGSPSPSSTVGIQLIH
jgi:hypothetical protein